MTPTGASVCRLTKTTAVATAKEIFPIRAFRPDIMKPGVATVAAKLTIKQNRMIAAVI